MHYARKCYAGALANVSWEIPNLRDCWFCKERRSSRRSPICTESGFGGLGNFLGVGIHAGDLSEGRLGDHGRQPDMAPNRQSHRESALRDNTDWLPREAQARGSDMNHFDVEAEGAQVFTD
jgi:hypothetical protein